MEMETEHSLHNMKKNELYAWCHMSRPACVSNHNHKMGAGGKINKKKSGLFFQDRKSAEKCKKSCLHFTDMDVLSKQVLFMI
jgi:hypothetical protein